MAAARGAWHPRCIGARLRLVHEPEEGSRPSCCSIAPVDADLRRRCRDSTPADRHVTRGCATRPTRPRSRRSSPSCAPRARTAPGSGCGRSSLCFGAAGLRIQEALAPAEADFEYRRGALLVRRGKGGRRREVGMDAWGWTELQPWLETRTGLPVGPLFCVLNGPTPGHRHAEIIDTVHARREPMIPVSTSLRT